MFKVLTNILQGIVILTTGLFVGVGSFGIMESYQSFTLIRIFGCIDKEYINDIGLSISILIFCVNILYSIFRIIVVKESGRHNIFKRIQDIFINNILLSIIIMILSFMIHMIHFNGINEIPIVPSGEVIFHIYSLNITSTLSIIVFYAMNFYFNLKYNNK